MREREEIDENVAAPGRRGPAAVTLGVKAQAAGGNKPGPADSKMCPSGRRATEPGNTTLAMCLVLAHG